MSAHVTIDVVKKNASMAKETLNELKNEVRIPKLPSILALNINICSCSV